MTVPGRTASLLTRILQNVAIAALNASIEVYKEIVMEGHELLAGRPAMRRQRLLRLLNQNTYPTNAIWCTYGVSTDVRSLYACKCAHYVFQL